jgi:hypothetical protein
MALKTREDVAAELQRVRESVRERALHPRGAADVLPTARAVKEGESVPPEAAPPPLTLPPPPDASAVNAHWRAEPDPPRGVLRLFDRLLRPLLAPGRSAQVEWNARQVRLDNELLAYVEARFAETHRHYDAVLGQTGRHLGEIDERHMILQEEVVAHVHGRGFRVDVCSVPFKWYPVSEIVRQALAWRLVDLTESNGTPVDLVIPTKFPS